VTNTGRMPGEELGRRLRAAGVEVEPISWYPAAYRWPASGPKIGSLLEFAAGLYTIQEEAAMLPVRLLDPRPGERVLDLCAAPGNKAAQIALALGPHGTLVANDRAHSRMASLGATLDRLGTLNISRTMVDGRTFPAQPSPFDRVLVDAPCSCLGTSRKSPGVLERYTERAGAALQAIQRQLLERAVELTKPGGRIVYSTCTYPPNENEGVISWLLGRRDDVALQPARVAGFVSRPGLTEWGGVSYGEALANTLRVWPHDNDTGGFFCAVLERR
jgi:NOL1/NOP2/sun family putative RNA methylase